MPKATWSGAVTFGMVSIPAKLYTATDAEKKIEFNQLNSKTGNRIKMKKVDAETGDEVANTDIIKGYEVTKGEYVTVTDAELDNVAPDKSSKIEIVGFVDPSTIDPLYLDKPYYLGSAEDINKPFALLKQAMLATGKVAIAKFTMRTKQYLCVIRPTPEGMSVSTLRYHDEVRNAKSVKTNDLPLTEKELAIATTLVEGMSDEVKLSDFNDEHRHAVMKMIDDKSKGIVAPPKPAPKVEKTDDLLAALEASVAMAQAKRKSA